MPEYTSLTRYIQGYISWPPRKIFPLPLTFLERPFPFFFTPIPSFSSLFPTLSSLVPLVFCSFFSYFFLSPNASLLILQFFYFVFFCLRECISHTCPWLIKIIIKKTFFCSVFHVIWRYWTWSECSCFWCWASSSPLLKKESQPWFLHLQQQFINQEIINEKFTFHSWNSKR